MSQSTDSAEFTDSAELTGTAESTDSAESTGNAGTIVLAGTRKGLMIGRSDASRADWTWTGPHFPMTAIYSVMIDKRGAVPRLLAGSVSSWFGPQVYRSDDLGATWQETPGGAIRFPEDTGASLTGPWQLTPGSAAGDDAVVWAGTEPGAIFRSTDRGETFELVRSLWDHPQREQWGQGYGGQAFHTVLPHPQDPDKVLAAISTGGVYVTSDGGATWNPSNTGVKCEFMPGEREYPEFGQCVHKVARDASDPERLYLQNHGGLYRSDDGGGSWVDIVANLPVEFGFPIVAHPSRGGVAYSFPIEDAGGRWPYQHKARVARTQDAGESWELLGEGQLPDEFYAAVMRDAMCADDHEVAGIYVGAKNGSVFASPDEGETWREINRDLPDVLTVRAAAL